MLRTLKPFAGPAFDFLVGIGVSVSPIQNYWLSGLFIGLGLFWGAAALLSNRAMIRRFPWLLEWMPFLDPTGGFATAEQLTGSYVKGQQFRIALLAEANEIRNRIFEDCVIHGPAVLMHSGYADHKDCTYALPPPLSRKNLHWIMKFEKDKTQLSEMPIGAILIRKCTFKQCTFVGIGFVGTEASAAEFEATLHDPNPIPPAD